MEWKCGKNEDNETLKATIPSTDYGRPGTTGDCAIFQLFGQPDQQIVQDIHIKLNPALPWQMQHSTRRLFSPANWTYI
jgi:hypothetical protein